ncbi:MAG: ADP-glyceromanno-heptose 6-epimerase, partial [Prevotella sp.]|nr:ADP-glyceromanno-heptose 6-epimerase [Prevotella sp.]
MGDKNVLVTGGLGFIGSNLIEKLDREGYSVILVDSFGNGEKWKNVSKRTNIIRFVKPCEIFDFMQDNEYPLNAVIHLGAISSTTESDVDLLVEVNYRLSIELYRWCRQKEIQFIYASSASVYGGDTAFDDSDDVKDINSLRPLNAYGWSKKETDLYIANDGGFGSSGSSVVGLRFFNVYGPNEYHKDAQSSVVYQFYNQVRNSGVVKLFKSTVDGIDDGEQKRDFVYVADCVELIVWLLNHKDIHGIYNVGTGEAKSFNSVASAIFKEMGLPQQVSFIEMPQNVKKHYQNYTVASLEKLRGVGYTGSFRSIYNGVR